MTDTTIRAPRAASTARPLLLGLLFAGTSVGVAACGKKDNANAQTVELPTLVTPDNIGIVDTMRIASGPSISGELTAEKSASVRSEVSGSVIQVFVEAGQRVAAGAPLARIDATTASAAALSARTGVTAQEAQVAQAKKELDRSERLNAAGAIADRDLENARLSYSTAMAQLANVKSAADGNSAGGSGVGDAGGSGCGTARATVGSLQVPVSDTRTVSVPVVTSAVASISLLISEPFPATPTE
jgi:multidrug efflux pump subunit AcrA (membrane-fusion protein)